MITKKDIKDGICGALKTFLAKAEEKGITGEVLEKAWGPKPAGKKLPREKPSVFAVQEGHRPLKPGEKLQHGDKVVGKQTPQGQYHPDEVWETVDEKHPMMGRAIGTWANVGKHYQRPISQQQPGQSPTPAASPSVRPPTPVSQPAPVSKIPDIGRMGGGIDYFDRSKTLPSPQSIKPSNSSQTSPAPVGAKAYSYSNHS
jgi:hypothetical protein